MCQIVIEGLFICKLSKIRYVTSVFSVEKSVTHVRQGNNLTSSVVIACLLSHSRAQ